MEDGAKTGSGEGMREAGGPLTLPFPGRGKWKVKIWLEGEVLRWDADNVGGSHVATLAELAMLQALGYRPIPFDENGAAPAPQGREWEFANTYEVESGNPTIIEGDLIKPGESIRVREVEAAPQGLRSIEHNRAGDLLHLKAFMESVREGNPSGADMYEAAELWIEEIDKILGEASEPESP